MTNNYKYPWPLLVDKRYDLICYDGINPHLRKLVGIEPLSNVLTHMYNNKYYQFRIEIPETKFLVIPIDNGDTAEPLTVHMLDDLNLFSAWYDSMVNYITLPCLVDNDLVDTLFE